jgi:hypothetical protein
LSFSAHGVCTSTKYNTCGCSLCVCTAGSG